VCRSGWGELLGASRCSGRHAAYLAQAGSEGEGYAEGKAVLKEFLQGFGDLDVCCVGLIGKDVSEAVVAIADDVGVFAPGLAEVGARHEVGSDTIFDACAVLEAELEYATAVERGGVSEVEGSFDETDVLKAKREDTGGFFERSVGER